MKLMIKHINKVNKNKKGNGQKNKKRDNVFFKLFCTSLNSKPSLSDFTFSLARISLSPIK